MTEAFRLSTMTVEDVKRAVDWAADEGWNPGLDDASAFHAVDPEGFLMGWLEDEPVTAISVVRHSESYAFLGFYLCVPQHRGKGLGLATWQAGLERLGNRRVGLDGVPAQQENYRLSGFNYAHHTQRYGGKISAHHHDDFECISTGDVEDVLRLDREVHGGVCRDRYLSEWVCQTKNRRTMVLRRGHEIHAVGTVRTCRLGHKIGPLLAPNRDVAQALIESLVALVDAEQVFVDIPDPNVDGVSMARNLGLSPAFACARMYKGPAPSRDLSRTFGEATFELG